MDITVIIGTLSGFVLAFAAEPIKDAIMKRVRRSDLRKALYVEAFANYLWLQRGKEKEGANRTAARPYLGRSFGVRTECARHALSQDLVLFYQLEEAPVLLVLYSTLEAITEWASLTPSEKDHRDIETTINSYLQNFDDSISDGSLDKEILEQVMPGAGNLIASLRTSRTMGNRIEPR